MTAEPADSEPRPEPGSHPDSDGWLGDFRRGPAVFSLYRETAHPLGPPEYRIECNDGAGPRTICQFFDEPEAVPEWFGAWKRDPWCPWILGRARRLIAEPENT
ncbi:hypothetical protein [Glycomyces terrestris]|uniref:Uncharacterized protein n=1 Tax=Glycomyces terrestris TaxID=2493553 RepID=A0A426V1J1_9ACTN|nr:hypothetical protein [Glycomyces terrestris]RRS00720.1 hypothetical protein EIW28_09265 [Glycomyces terrestris]